MNAIDPIAAIREALEESARVKTELRDQAERIHAIAGQIAERFERGGRLYACGNGGSACDAMHLVEELVARYQLDRPGLPAHHLLDAATLTCWSNDHEFATAFRRQVETMVGPGDVLVAITTSGSSTNVVEAVKAARSAGAMTIALTGRSGGEVKGLADETLFVPSDVTARVQEGHIAIIHLLCELIERMMFGDLRTTER